MTPPAINLLNWRASQAKSKLRHDIILAIVLLGALALLVEISFMLTDYYLQYLNHKQTQLSQIINQQDKDYKQAQQAQTELNRLKTLITQQENNQTAWKNLAQNLNRLAQAKPAAIKILQLNWQKQGWLIDGFSESIDYVTLYQKNLLAQNLKTEINQWQPKKTNNVENFQLSITP